MNNDERDSDKLLACIQTKQCAIVTCMTRLQANGIARAVFKTLGSWSLDEALERIEREAIVIALEACDQHCTLAAKVLNIKRTALVEKRRRFGMKLRPRRAKV